MERHIHAQIAAGDHDGVGRVEDVYRLLDLDFGDARAAPSGVGQTSTGGAQVFAAADVGRSDEFDVGGDGELDGGYRLVGDVMRGGGVAWRGYRLVALHQSAAAHDALDVLAGDAVDALFDDAFVDEDGGPGTETAVQSGGPHGAAVRRRGDALGGQRESVAGFHQDADPLAFAHRARGRRCRCGI